MTNSTLTRTSNEQSRIFGKTDRVPVILVAYAPEGTATVDRCLLSSSFIIGRSSKAELTLLDNKTSKKHLRISNNADGFWIEDLESTNGTFVNGIPVTKTKRKLTEQSVIRVGRSVLIFQSDGEDILDAPASGRSGMAGKFHIGPLLIKLREAALSKRHILLTGASGSGKESAAGAIAEMSGADDKPLSIIAHNAAGFASSEEATTTLLGVGPRVFSGVEARPGLVERAGDGVLFLDEVHNIEERVQRSLLRIIEDGKVTRVGETVERKADLRFVFASNVGGPDHGLAHDLLARLRLVHIAPLAERIADVPSIFSAVLGDALGKHYVERDSVFSLLSGDHYEALCLDGFKDDNVRGLINLADRLATRIAAGTEAKKAVATVFAEQFADGAVAARYSGNPLEDDSSSHYEMNKKHIVAAFKECEGNFSATERRLRDLGIRCSRRWLKTYLERWGVI